MDTLVLELTFKNAVGKTVTFNINDPKQPLDPAAVGTAMDAMIASNIFEPNGGGLVSKEGARVINKDIEVLTLV